MRDEGRKTWDIRDRAFQYALRAIKLYRATQARKDPAGRILGKQYLRSATSIGANIEEAQSGESRADFIHKYCIAQKEARESLYWLRLMGESDILKKGQLDPLIKETNEIVSVITAIIVRAKKNKSETHKGKSEV
jgi:four helix bundle protein